MARTPIPLLLLGITLLVMLAGCGKNWGEIEAVGLDEPRMELPRLPMAQAIAASVGRLNSYAVFEGEEPSGRIALATIPWDIDGPDVEGRAWRTYETKGSYVEFQLIPEAGYALTRIHNPRNEATIVFDDPLLVAPSIIALDDPHTNHAAFEGWARGWSRRQGTITVTTRYLGLQDVTVPLGRVADCARLDALVRIKLPLGFSLTMNHRQWLHPVYGDVVRDINGRVSWSMFGVKTFHRRLELAESVLLDEGTKNVMIERGTGVK